MLWFYLKSNCLILPGNLLLSLPNTARHYGGLYVRLLAASISHLSCLRAGSLHLSFASWNGTCQLPCQVGILWLNVIDWRSENCYVSHFVRTAGNDYSPISGYFGRGVRAPYEQSSAQCPVGVHGDGSLILTSEQQTKIRLICCVCEREVSGWAALLWKLWLWLRWGAGVRVYCFPQWMKSC